MIPLASMLKALQHADSAFPSGSFAFSQGLEATFAQRQVLGGYAFASFIACQIHHRWATADRVALARAHRQAHDLAAVARVDHKFEASSPVERLRLGSRANGRAFLTAHSRLSTPGAVDYLALVGGC